VHFGNYRSGRSLEKEQRPATVWDQRGVFSAFVVQNIQGGITQACWASFGPRKCRQGRRDVVPASGHSSAAPVAFTGQHQFTGCIPQTARHADGTSRPRTVFNRHAVNRTQPRIKPYSSRHANGPGPEGSPKESQPPNRAVLHQTATTPPDETTVIQQARHSPQNSLHRPGRTRRHIVWPAPEHPAASRTTLVIVDVSAGWDRIGWAVRSGFVIDSGPCSGSQGHPAGSGDRVGVLPFGWPAGRQPSGGGWSFGTAVASFSSLSHPPRGSIGERGVGFGSWIRPPGRSTVGTWVL